MKHFMILCLLLILSVSAAAQKRYDEITYPELNKFEKTKVEEFKLKNGITFYLVEDHELPLIRLNTVIRTGSLLDPAGKTGLAGMTGSVMREGGSEKYPADELNVLLEDKAASMSTFISQGSGNASMSILKEDFDTLLPVFIDLLQHPQFPEDKIELYKTQMKSAISRRNDEQASIANREFQKLIYGQDSPYTRQEEYDTIDAIEREDLVRFHKASFTGNNMMIGVIGDFNTKTMKKKLQKAFSDIPAGSKTALPYSEVNYNYPSTINFINKTDVNQSYILMGHIGGLRDNPDYAALQMMNEVLSGGFAGRLFQKVRSELGLAYAVGGSYSSNINYPGVFGLFVMTKSSTTAASIDAILAEVKRLQQEAPSQKELSDARDRFLNSLVFKYDSKQKILSERISNEYNGLPQDAFDKYTEELQKVTAADVQRVAKKYLHPDKVQILVVGNKDEIGSQLTALGPVSEIDITIPLPADEAAEETAGDKEAGAEWLKKMAEAVIAPGTELHSSVTESSDTQATPMGTMETKSTTTIRYADFSLNSKVDTPQGTVELDIADGSGTLSMMGQKQQMPDALVSATLRPLKDDYLNIARIYPRLEAEFMGTEEADGVEYAVIKVKNEGAVTFLVNPETGIPLEARASEFNPQAGKTVITKTVYSDWKTIDGIQIAHKTVTYLDGEEAASSEVRSVSINK